MTSVPDQAVVAARRATLAERLRPRVQVEEYFQSSGRTFRKSRLRLWFNLRVKARLMKLAFRLMGIYGRGVRNSTAVRVRRVVFKFADLPAEFDGFRILHLSDLHIDGVDGLAEALESILKQISADVCVLTGDYRFEMTGSCEEVYPRMERVVASIRSRHGILGTLGNHDAAEIAYRLEEMGVRMLVNESVEIREKGASIRVAGVDDQFDYRRADLPLALENVPQGSFSVLLAHDPQLYKMAAAEGIALYLCGHTHAGQIRLPVVGAAKKNAPVPRKYLQSEWRYQGGLQGYTTWGAGCSTIPVRFNCPPEVAILELRRS